VTDFKINYPGLGAAIHALNARAKRWIDEYTDGIPLAAGWWRSVCLPHVIEAAVGEGFRLEDADADASSPYSAALQHVLLGCCRRDQPKPYRMA
jgi:hypothetical protein